MAERVRQLRLVFLAIAAVALTACTSPEATRARGGGSGADVGNRREEVRMHSGAHPYWETPVIIPAKHPPLESARHAAESAANDRRKK